MTYFPLNEAWPLYLGFTAFVLLMLALDLGVFHRKAHAVKFREAAIWTAVWISLAFVFNGLLYFYSGQHWGEEVARRLSLEFLTGFVVEKSLAVDNVFVFAVVFNYFAIPAQFQHRLLFFGILGALVFRAIFIAIGSQLMAYHGVVIFFGVLLVLTGVKMLFSPDKGAAPDKNPVLKLLRRLLPITNQPIFDRFWVRENGVRMATPLFVALVFLEITDVIFAVDSVPAIFALTNEPFLVFTSNIFAILGLRSMYFLLAGMLDRFIYIKYGLGAVLIFVGLKMTWLNHLFDGKFPISWSLAIIALLIGGSVAASLWVSRKAGNSTVAGPMDLGA